MLRDAVIVVAILVMVSAAPAFADDAMKCDDASMVRMQKQIDAAVMKKQYDMANEDLKMAMEAMKAADMVTCATHLNSAAKYLRAK